MLQVMIAARPNVDLLPNRSEAHAGRVELPDVAEQIEREVAQQEAHALSVQAENGAFANAQCFTSLDGASYAL